LRAAKGKFSPVSIGLAKEISSRSVSFDENVQLQIIGADSVTEVSLPITSTDRVQIVDIFGEQKPREKNLEFEKLKERERVDIDQVKFATGTKLSALSFEYKGSLGLFEGHIKQSSTFIVNELIGLLDTLPNKEIGTIEELREALKKNVQAYNKRAELIDRETFKTLIGPPKIPGDVIYAPEYHALKTANQNDEWKDEERKITFTQIPDESLPKFLNVIDLFFEDEAVRSTLSKFLV
jgi:hypothetical protein